LESGDVGGVIRYTSPPELPAGSRTQRVVAPESTQRTLIQPNAQNQYQVTREDLPLSCPMPQMYLWNSHPRVYLPIEPTGWAKCPYCGAEYSLTK
jgi:uncharacterized Zn-finger protein